jgi:hypothetical protein
MISLSAAIKAGVVCMSLLSPDVLFCHRPHLSQVLVCEADGCRTQREFARTWTAKRRAKFALEFYGVTQRDKSR